MNHAEVIGAHFSKQKANGGIECIINQSGSWPGLSMVEALVRYIPLLQCKERKQ